MDSWSLNFFHFKPSGMDDEVLWASLGSGDFKPDSLGSDLFDGMDLGQDDEAELAAVRYEVAQSGTAAMQQQAVGAGTVFPANPGPVVPLQAPQDFSEPLSAAVCVSPDSQALLNKVFDFQRLQRANLDKLRLAQLQILCRPAPGPMAMLGAQIQAMLADTKAAMQALVHAWCIGHLSPMEIWRWDFLWRDLDIQQTQLLVYERELRGEPGPHAALALISHPFPVVGARGRVLEGSLLRGQLLTGAATSVVQAAQLRAEAVIPADTKGRLPPGLLEGASASLETPSCAAAFPELGFAAGTRKQPVHIRLRLVATLRSGSGVVQQLELVSSLPPAAVGVTNEVQWEESEGLLLHNSLFVHGPKTGAPWHSLANYLQRQLVRATRQSVTRLERSLSSAELNYFHQHFFQGQATVSETQYLQWWRWYGKALHRIRYTKHCLSLFLSGHLTGFIAKPHMEQVLAAQPTGTFLVRFSESNPGAFSVAYVAPDGAGVRHYLLSPDDLTPRKVTNINFKFNVRRSIIE